MMRERFFTWCSSLQIRLIITSVAVTTFSFILLFLLLQKPVEGVLMNRERAKLEEIAHTLGTTLRTPWMVDREIWHQDAFWTQRRCHDLAPVINARIRMLDAHGQVLTDSFCRGTDHSPTDPCCNRNQPVWERERKYYPNLSDRREVQDARLGQTTSSERLSPDGKPILFVAKPILREEPTMGGKKRVAFIFYLDKPLAVARKEVNKEFTMLERLFLTCAIISLLATIVVSAVVSGPLSADLRSATRIAQHFAAGGMQQRMPIHGRDEVGQLAIAFNQMADALQRHEQLRRDLLADVSHELRTPLTAIAGCADTLADGVLLDNPEAGQRFLEIIMKESERLQRLVADILELSRLQAGAVPIPCEPVALLPMIADAVEIARLHARHDEVGLNIAYHPPEEDPDAPLLVMANEDRLMQALRNLLDNARHHSPTGGTVTVAVATQAAEVIVSVSDEGEGIPPEHLTWVFDRFYRAGKGAKPGGTGLGLAIVREIMHALGGTITVESTVGKGTTFSLHLPHKLSEEGAG